MNFEKDIEQMSRKYIVRIETCSNGKSNRYTVYGKAMEAISSNEVYHPQSNDGLTVEEIVDIIERNQQVKFCSNAKEVRAKIKDRDFFNMFIYFNKKVFGKEYAVNYFCFCSTAFTALAYMLYLLTLPFKFVYYSRSNFIRG